MGCTKNFKDRMARHRRGEVKYTSSKLPVEVVTVIALPDKYKAIQGKDVARVMLALTKKNAEGYFIHVNSEIRHLSNIYK